MATRKRDPLPPKQCPGCPLVFIPKRTNQEYHSPVCGTAHWTKLHRPPLKAKHPKRRRDRKRERLQRIVNRKVRTWSLDLLVALFGEEGIAARYDTWVDHMILRGLAEGRGVAG